MRRGSPKSSPKARPKDTVKDFRYDVTGHIDESISQLLWDLMEESKVTSAELAKKAKVSKTYVRDVLRGTKKLNVKQAIKLFGQLDCEIDFIVLDPKEKP